jgi:enamine deaminase RidA (YjgF/YER057c/UK114 family)
VSALRRRVFTVSPWEDRVGYSRAVEAGNMIFVAGTTSTDPKTGKIQHPGDMGRQAEAAFANALAALARLDASAEDVVRVTMFVTDMDRFEEVVPKHKAAFGAHPPAATVVEVQRLAHPDLVFEVEVTAVRHKA